MGRLKNSHRLAANNVQMADEGSGASDGIQPLPFKDFLLLLSPVCFTRHMAKYAHMTIGSQSPDQAIDPFAISVAPFIASRLWNQPQNHYRLRQEFLPQFDLSWQLSETTSSLRHIVGCPRDVSSPVQIDMNGL